MDDRLYHLPTSTTSVDAFTPMPSSVYITGQSDEERARTLPAQVNSDNTLTIISIREVADFLIEIRSATFVDTIRLRSGGDLQGLANRLSARHIYLDITSLSHHVWAPLLKTFMAHRSSIDVLYIEPDDYRPNPHPLRGEIFALSEKIRGLSPIPGFASLSNADGEDFCFVPLLGFEGARFAYLLEKVQPSGDNVVPVIGVPGFRLEYPFHTYQGNRQVLTSSKSWRNVRYARANCPFSLYFLLEQIARDRNCKLKIAPIGTKPHALGAVLFAIFNPGRSELIYDHPIRKTARTIGRAQLLRYPLDVFLTAYPAAHV